jgi:hypothetical protein
VRFEDGFETSDLMAAKDIVTDCRSILRENNGLSQLGLSTADLQAIGRRTALALLPNLVRS